MKDLEEKIFHDQAPQHCMKRNLKSSSLESKVKMENKF
jgi:hypothetical protein